MKQGVLYLQLQQTFGKVRRGQGAAECPGNIHGGLGRAGHGGVQPRGAGSSHRLDPHPSTSSPPIHQLSTSMLCRWGWEMGAHGKQKHPSPQLDPPSNVARAGARVDATPGALLLQQLIMAGVRQQLPLVPQEEEEAARASPGREPELSLSPRGLKVGLKMPQAGQQAGHCHPDDASVAEDGAEATLGAQKHTPAKGSRVLAQPAGMGSYQEDALLLMRDFLCRCLPLATAGASCAQSTLNCAASEGESFWGIV